MNGELRRQLPANQSAIEAFCWDYQQWLGHEVPPRLAFASELVLREALVNAVEHGCNGLNNASVHCIVRGGRGRILIAVQDPGPGFDWRNWPLEPPDAEQLRGRGVMIFRNYAQNMRFNRKGNAVVLRLRLDDADPALKGEA